jgi:hypothetical protein
MIHIEKRFRLANSAEQGGTGAETNMAINPKIADDFECGLCARSMKQPIEDLIGLRLNAGDLSFGRQPGLVPSIREQSDFAGQPPGDVFPVIIPNRYFAQRRFVPIAERQRLRDFLCNIGYRP